MYPFPDFSELLTRMEQYTVIDSNTDCWLWGGIKTKKGYGEIRIGDKKYGIHRISALIFHNLNIFDGKQLATHIPACPNRNCWNPKHIVIGDCSTNAKDVQIVGNFHNQYGGANKTHCIRDHPLEGDNLIITPKGHRRCRTCSKIHRKRNWINNGR